MDVYRPRCPLDRAHLPPFSGFPFLSGLDDCVTVPLPAPCNSLASFLSSGASSFRFYSRLHLFPPIS